MEIYVIYSLFLAENSKSQPPILDYFTFFTLKWNYITFYHPQVNLLLRFWQELYVIVCDVKPCKKQDIFLVSLCCLLLCDLCLFSFNYYGNTFPSVVRYFQDYTEPSESNPSTPAATRYDINPMHPAPQASEDDKVVLPLGDKVLSDNLGIPIVVVLTKVKYVHELCFFFFILISYCT